METSAHGAPIAPYSHEQDEQDINAYAVEYHCVQLEVGRWKTTASPKHMNQRNDRLWCARSMRQCRNEQQTKIEI